MAFESIHTVETAKMFGYGNSAAEAKADWLEKEANRQIQRIERAVDRMAAELYD